MAYFLLNLIYAMKAFVHCEALPLSLDEHSLFNNYAHEGIIIYIEGFVSKCAKVPAVMAYSKDAESYSWLRVKSSHCTLWQTHAVLQFSKTQQ